MVVGDSSIGRTGVFGASDPRSSRGPRASGEVRPLGYVESAPLVEPVKLGHRYISNPLPAPCRHCGGPSWLSDDLGAIHPCCELMWTEASGCLSCRASETLNREQRRRGKKVIHQPSAYKGVDDDL